MKSALKALAFALFFILSTHAFSAGPGSFQSFPTYPTLGSDPSAVALGDFNHDGSLDMAAVVGLNSESFVAIFLNNGDGTFKPAVSYPAGSEPVAVAVGDFNHDGKLDLAIANSTPIGASKSAPGNYPGTCAYGCVMVLLGNGDGTFQPGVGYTADAGADSIAVADFNGDGKVDLVTSNSQGNTVSVLLGNGDGTFKPAVNYAIATGPGLLAVGDFNGDHHPDIAVANDSTTGGVQVLLGKGDGTFQPPVTYSTGGIDSLAIAVADFNGDGKLDLAVGFLNLTLNTSGIAILFGNGDGTFQSPSTIPLGPWNAGSSSLVSGDANGDGNVDLIAGTTGGFTIALGNGDGTFQSPVSYSGFNQRYGFAAVVGDVNGDNKLDIAAINTGGVSVISGFGDGTFPAPRLYNTGTYTTGLVAADFNKDGFVDVANSVDILLGNGDGTFTTGTPYTAGSAVSGVAGDFNHDGNLDLAWVNYIPKGTVYVLSGNGDGTFKKAMNNKAHKDPSSIVTADFNRDGNLDLVTANFNSSDISVLLGNGDGTFKPAVDYLIGSLSPATNILATADFNGDGNLDLAVVNNGGIGISLGNGDGTFKPQVMYAASAYSVAVADINHDGKLDLLTTGADSTGALVQVLLGNGDGTFQPVITSPGGQMVLASLADFNGDGLLDIVTVPLYPYPSSPIAVQFGNSDGTFQAPVYYNAGNQPIRATAADFNGDGAPDLAIGSLSGVTINLNTGGTFLATTNAPNPSTLQQNVTFTTTVAASLKGQPLPSGKVTFTDGTNTLGSATLSNGQAIFTTSFSTSGQHQITPTYSGDSNFNPHTGATVVQTVQAPTVNLSPTTLNFGNQKVGTTSAPMTAKLTNRGAGALLISSISWSGNDFLFTNNCGSSLAQNKSCTLTVTFKPTKTGPRTGVITITDNALNSPQKVTLTGTGD